MTSAKNNFGMVKNFAGELKVGMPVYMSLYDKGEGVIVALRDCNTNGKSTTDGNGTTVTTHGGSVEIIFKNSGEKSDNTSEYLLRKGIQYGVIEGAPMATKDEIKQLTLFSEKQMKNLQDAAKAKKEKEELEIAQCRDNSEYSHLTQLESIYAGKEIAKNIRADLKRNFKGQKFSVCSDHNTVEVVIKGDADKESVKALVSKFKITRINNTEKQITEEVVTPFNRVFGCLDYVFVS